MSVTFVPQLDRGILDPSMPSGATDLSYVQKRYMRYDKPSLRETYEYPPQRRVVLPILAGIAMLGVFALWIYMYWTGMITNQELMSETSVRRRGAPVVAIWLIFILIFVGGIALIKIGIRNWKARRVP